jgi:hypothetical protein
VQQLLDCPPTAKKRRHINVTLTPEYVSALERFIQSQDVPSPVSQALDVALREFLEKRGFLAAPDSRQQQARERRR